MKKRLILMTALISTMILTGCSNDNIKEKRKKKRLHRKVAWILMWQEK
ncbi:hypothetical protein [Paraclostridium sp. AKS73]|nr:hypothetical protein [Paraclostridium sp. AKS73]MCU9816886.1 hypothetical protein [Paraclostridium sp. AKS73]